MLKKIAWALWGFSSFPIAAFSMLALGAIFGAYAFDLGRAILFYVLWGFLGYMLYDKTCKKVITTAMANLVPLVATIISISNVAFLRELFSADAHLIMYLLSWPVQFLSPYNYISDGILQVINIVIMITVFYLGCFIHEKRV